MLRPNYTLLDAPGQFSVIWNAPHLPAEFMAVGIVLALIGGAIVLCRARLAAALQKEFGAAWSRLGLYIGAGAAAAVLDAAGILLAGPQRSFIRWDFTAEAVGVKSMNGDLTFPWKTVASAKLDAGG